MSSKTTALPTTATAHAVAPIDTAILRKVLRLVHCLQKERGASCAYRAAAPRRHERKVSVLLPARRDTDRALLRLGPQFEPMIQSTLLKIRKIVYHKAPSSTLPSHNLEISNRSNATTCGFHKILLCYNTLIQHIVHEYILRFTSFQRQLHRQAHRGSAVGQHVDPSTSQPSDDQKHSKPILSQRSDSMASSSSLPQNKHNPMFRIPSHQTLLDLGVPVHHHSFGRQHSDVTDVHLQRQRQQRRQKPLQQQSSSHAASHKRSLSFTPETTDWFRLGDDQHLDNVLHDDDELEGQNKAAHLKRLHYIDVSSSSSSMSSNNQEDGSGQPDVVLLQLVDLLDVFVRLKESAGIERATLSSILAAGASSSTVDARMLLNSLVLEVEHQRRQLEEMQRLPAGTWHDLVQEFISTMAPQMRQLQDDILSGSLQQMWDERRQLYFNDDHGNDATEDDENDHDENQLWSLLTLYINKLHSMELLLVEEMECCVVHSCTSPSHTADRTQRRQTAAPHVTVDGNQQSQEGNETNTDVLGRAFGCKSTAELSERIASLSASDVKQRLLSYLQTSSISPPASPKANRQVMVQPSVIENNGDPSSGSAVDELLTELTKAPASKEWEIDLYEVQFMKRIGQGAAGTTYLAKWSGLEVAVKVASITEMGLDGWRKEVQALQKLHHPNIIRLLGSVYHPNPLTFCLVLEYCNAGDLVTALQKVTPRNFFFHVASSIAKGMTYLHHRGIIHRDIKPANVLLDGNVASGIFSVKVTDLGVATENTGCADEKTAETGTYRWMPPEVIRHEMYTQTADVYSFGVLLWQLVTREAPFADMNQIEAASRVAMHNERPPMPEGIPAPVKELIEHCWAGSPEQRPSFDEIAERLVTIERSLSAEEKQWIEAPLGHRAYQESVKEVKPRQNPINSKKIYLEEHKKLKTPKKHFIKSFFSRKSTHF